MWRINNLKRLLNVLMMLIVVAVAGCEFGFNENESMQKAKNYHETGKYSAAVIEFKKVLNHNSSNKTARVLLAKTYLELEQVPSAEKELRFAQKSGVPLSEIADLLANTLLKQSKYDDVIKEVPLTAAKDGKIRSELMIAHGYAYLAKNNISEAKSLFEQVKKDNHIPAVANVALALVSISGGDVKQAEDYIEAAIAADEKNQSAWLTKGQIQLEKKDVNHARQSFEKVVSLSNEKRAISMEFRARVNLVRLALAENNLQLAKEKSDQLLTAVPNHPLSKYFSAIVAYENKDYEKARELLENILVIAPDDAQSKLLLGAVHFAQNNYEMANKFLSIYVENVPANIQARKMLAAVQVKLGYGDDAYNSLKSALDANQNDAELLAMIGKTAMLNKRNDEAIDFLKKAKKEKPGNSQISAELAKAYMMKGSFDEAIIELKRVTGDSSKQARNILVYVHLQKKDYVSARNLAEQLIKESSGSPIPYTIAGTVEVVAGDRAKAKDYYKQALQKDGKHVPALISLARLAYEDDSLDESERYYNLILKNDSSNETAYIGLATIADNKGDSDKAISVLEQGLNNKSDSLAVGMVLGQYYLKTKQNDKGLKVISRMASTHQDKPQIASVLVQAQLIAGKKQDALTTATAMTKKWLNQPEGYLELARVHMALEQNNQAERSLDAALKIKPDLIQAKTALVMLYLKTGREQKAINYAGQIQKEYPKSSVGYVLAGEIHMAGKKYHLAQKEYTAALSVQKSADIVFKLSKSYKLAGQDKQAVTVLQDWLKHNPSDEKIRLQLAVLYTYLNDQQNAIAQYQQLLKNNPDNQTVMNNLAILYMSSDLNKASELAKKAYTLKPDIAAIADTYGWILYKSGKNENALPILQEAANKSEHPSIRYHYAVVLTKSGKNKEAKDILEKLLSKDFEEAQEAKKLYSSL